MPAEPLDLWKSRPFEPEIRDGRIWARGADDDKGQAMMQVKGFETALNLDLLKCNVKFIFEGEEEIGSPSLEAFCRTHKELLKADVILVSDTSMVSAETPSLTTGLRGLAYWEIEVTGPNRDLHSGHFGGAVANPINVLCKLMADITDADGRITIPGFYDDVADVSVLIAGGQAEPNGGSLTGGGEYQIFPLPWRSLDFNGAQTPLWVGRHEVVQILHHQGIIRLAQSVAVRGDVLLEIRNRRQQNLKVEAAYGLVLR